MIKKFFLSIIISLSTVAVFAQDKLEMRRLDYDPDQFKIIPDKVFEMGIPLLFLFFVIQVVVAFGKNRAENALKLKMIEKDISEDSLVEIFRESNAITRLQPLKWFLFTLATGLALLIIHFSRGFLIGSSGYLAVGIIMLMNALAFGIYYYVLTRKIK